MIHPSAYEYVLELPADTRLTEIIDILNTMNLKVFPENTDKAEDFIRRNPRLVKRRIREDATITINPAAFLDN